MTATKPKTELRTRLSERRLSTLHQYLESNPDFEGSLVTLVGSIKSFQDHGLRACRAKESDEVYAVFCPTDNRDKGLAEYLTRYRPLGTTVANTEVGVVYVSLEIDGVYKYTRSGALAAFFGLTLKEVHELFNRDGHSENFVVERQWIADYLDL